MTTYQTWGPKDDPQTPAAPSTTGALFSHLSHVLCLITGFPYLAWIPALAIRASARDEHTRSHATTALNFVLTQLIAWGAGFLALVGLMTVGTFDDGHETLFLLGLIPLCLGFLAYLAFGVAYSIIGMMRATRLEPFQYPVYLAFPMVR
ncbi:DUF4870 domain-containing protein [Streptomyces sp. NBC_01304]|uniref:DUF4870 domain-containing protein n=1 Tax=Streptomyces sp. NBC_01304 TaxID=2903818 RepID=UPI002E13E692|nr:DUF4870 domain-containing protein [Streptomyces sp. NBC_01304]